MPPTPRAAACDYVELRCRSAFSFLDGASNPEDLVARAAEQGHGALALADRDGLYGAPRFHAAARAAGLRPIVGAEVTLEDGPGSSSTCSAGHGLKRTTANALAVSGKSPGPGTL